MRENNVIKEKTMAFAIRIVNLYKFLCADKKEFVLSKQILRSGTSIGVMYEKRNTHKVVLILLIK